MSDDTGGQGQSDRSEIGVQGQLGGAPIGDQPSTTPLSTPPVSQVAAAGWFADANNPGHERYWDGSSWTEQRRPAPSAAGPSPSTERKSSDERKALLAQQLQFSAAQGGRIESQSDYQAVITKGKPVNHVLHAIVSIFSCGIWLLVWLILALTGGERREMIVIDEFGNVLHQRLGKS